MVCDATTVTKGQVSNEQLRQLLTPEITKAIAEAFAQDHGLTVRATDTYVQFSKSRGYYYGSTTITYFIESGQIDGRNDDDDLVPELQKTLNMFAGRLFTNLVAQIVEMQAGKAPTMTEVQGEENGVVKTYQLLEVTY